MKLGLCSMGSTPLWLVGIAGFFHALSEEKQFSVGLIDQPSSNQVVPGATALQQKTIEKVFSSETSTVSTQTGWG